MSTTIVASDLDGTLTTAEFWRGVLDWLVEYRPSRAARGFVRDHVLLVVSQRLGLVAAEGMREKWLHDLARLFAGMPADRLPNLADQVLDRCLWPGRRPDVLDLVLRAHADAAAVDPDAKLVLATSAFQPVADAFARRIGADLVLGTPLEVKDGILTGKLDGRVGGGQQKADAVLAVAAGGPVAAAFGDRASDAPLLRLAERAFAVAPDKALRQEAVRAGWTIVEGG